MGLQRIHLEQERMHKPRVGIQVESVNQQRKQGRDVCVHHFEQPDTDQQQQASLDQLEHRDGHDAGMVRTRLFPHGTYLYHRCETTSQFSDLK